MKHSPLLATLSLTATLGLLLTLPACVQHPLEGKPAPALVAPTAAGSQFDLSTHKGREVVLLDFWATWCPPCREALPEIAGLAKRFAGKPVQIVAMNVGDSVEDVTEFLKEQELSLAVGFDQGSDIARRFGVNVLPTTMLIDRQGMIAKVFTGYGPGMEDDLATEIERLLGAP